MPEQFIIPRCRSFAAPFGTAREAALCTAQLNVITSVVADNFPRLSAGANSSPFSTRLHEGPGRQREFAWKPWVDITPRGWAKWLAIFLPLPGSESWWRRKNNKFDTGKGCEESHVETYEIILMKPLRILSVPRRSLLIFRVRNFRKN